MIRFKAINPGDRPPPEKQPAAPRARDLAPGEPGDTGEPAPAKKPAKSGPLSKAGRQAARGKAKKD